MEQLFHGGTDTLLFLLIGVIAFFLKREIDSNAMKHDKHFAHSTDLSLHETDRERVLAKDGLKAMADELIRHGATDDKRFEIMDNKMGVISADIKEILKAVSK